MAWPMGFHSQHGIPPQRLQHVVAHLNLTTGMHGNAIAKLGVEWLKNLKISGHSVNPWHTEKTGNCFQAIPRIRRTPSGIEPPGSTQFECHPSRLPSPCKTWKQRLINLKPGPRPPQHLDLPYLMTKNGGFLKWGCSKPSTFSWLPSPTIHFGYLQLWKIPYEYMNIYWICWPVAVHHWHQQTYNPHRRMRMARSGHLSPASPNLRDHGGFLSHWGTSSHPFIDGILYEINHQIPLGNHPFMENTM